MIWSAACILSILLRVQFASAMAIRAATSPVQLFVFGSSWSETLFDVNGVQPSPSNPLGNPQFNDPLPREGGPNYARFLTVKYNTTLTLLYDLAVAGATIDNDILPVAGVPAYDEQVNSLWAPNYGSKKGTVWDSSSAIFLVWLGSNDIYWGYNSTTPDALVSQLMDAYWNTITEKLYASGARKFYFVAPTSQERAPLMLQAGAANIQKYLQFKWKYSDALVQRLAAFKTKHSDVQTALFNSTAFLNPILDNTASFGFNADNTCEKDIAGAAAKCVWEDNFHVNTRVHDLMAQAMVPGLKTVGF